MSIIGFDFNFKLGYIIIYISIIILTRKINFDSKGQKAALLDYVLVRPEYRGQHIAKKIWNYKIKEQNDSKYFYLWVNTVRESAICFHQKNGFYFDGMVDYIFTNK